MTLAAHGTAAACLLRMHLLRLPQHLLRFCYRTSIPLRGAPLHALHFLLLAAVRATTDVYFFSVDLRLTCCCLRARTWQPACGPVGVSARCWRFGGFFFPSLLTSNQALAYVLFHRLLVAACAYFDIVAALDACGAA